MDYTQDDFNEYKTQGKDKYLQKAIELNPENERARDYFEQLQRKYRQTP